MKFALLILMGFMAGDCHAQFKIFDFGPAKSENVVVSPQVPTKPNWPDERIYGRWTWPGYPSTAALRRHLAQPPHRIDSSRMSNRQIIDYHNREHDRIGPVPARRQTRPYCPT